MTDRIGGMFCLEKITEQGQPFFKGRGESARYYMSGRCALYACLCELNLVDRTKIAYVPAYTCETVLSSYQKAGYTLRFYDVDRYLLTPLFKKEDLPGVSVLALCSYFGFSSYDRSFVKECKRRGITILQDITHSPFSLDGFCPEADFYAGSLRKWMGIACGGIAIKKNGQFTIAEEDPDEDHLKGRYQAMELRAKALQIHDNLLDNKANEVFWSTEMRLRQIFGRQGSDLLSKEILDHFDPTNLFFTRRRNYQVILDNLVESNQCKPVFPSLGENSCPSHFSFYVEDRKKAQGQLEKRGIKSSVYWPMPPMLEKPENFFHATWIYEHICSVQIDQRYQVSDMEYLGMELSRLT